MPHRIIGDFVRFTLAYNPGAAFSMSLGPYSRYIFGAFAVIALFVLWRLYRMSGPAQRAGDRVRILALGLAWGGAAGNLIDRFRSPLGVVDFIDIGVGDVRFWTFNVADSAVTVGALVLAWSLSREEREERHAREAAASRAARAPAWPTTPARSARDAERRGPTRERRRRRPDAPVTSWSRRRARHGSTCSSPARSTSRAPRPRRSSPTGTFAWTAGAERASYRPDAGERVVVDDPAAAGPRGRRRGRSRSRSCTRTTTCWWWTSPPAWSCTRRPATGRGTLVNALKGRGRPLSEVGGDERAGIVHRLDKETSGLLLVAKTDRAHRVLGAAIAARRDRPPVRGALLGAPRRRPADGRQADRARPARPKAHGDRQYGTGGANGLRAARPLRRRWTCCARTCTPGARIRSACISRRVGHPVVGDDTYGGGGGRRLVALPPQRHFLHAAWLRFRHPATGAPMDLRVAAAGRPACSRSPAPRAPMPSFADTDPLEHFGFFRDDSPETREPPRATLLFRVAGTVYGCDIEAVREIIPSGAPRDCPARRRSSRG